MYDAVHAEQLGTPTVSLCNHEFSNDAKSAASGKGIPGVRFVRERVPCECTEGERVAAGIREVMDEVVAALTEPLTDEEQSPAAKEPEISHEVVFRGNLEEVNSFYYKRGWTDGLPIVPPTAEAVREMMRGTDLPADHVVARIIPRMGKATVDKIAINAVMAGALPTYLPVLIAGVQALMDPKPLGKWDFGTWEVSTGSWAPFYVINGPIREQLRINSGSGTLSPGNIANAAIGRAMALIVKNIGGARKGIEDMGVMGNPGKYTLVAGENEEASPWQPLHVQHGFKAEDSCVTVSFPNSLIGVLAHDSSDLGILRSAVCGVVATRPGLNLLVNPVHAKTLADAGWTKEKIAAHLIQNAVVPASRHPDYWGQGWFGKGSKESEEPVPVLDEVKIIVAGGAGAFLGVIQGRSTDWTTKKIELPADWDNLVRKYKHLEPNHVRY